MATDRGLAHPGGRRPLDGEGGHELGLKLSPRLSDSNSAVTEPTRDGVAALPNNPSVCAARDLAAPVRIQLSSSPLL
jgi:hypothetical protein